MRSLVVALVFLFAAAPGRAADLSVSFSPDPREDSPITATVTGSAPRGSTVDVGWTYGPACDDADYAMAVEDHPVEGAYTVTAPLVLEEPGDVLLCARLSQTDDEDATKVLAEASVPMPVRSNRATIQLAAPQVGALGRALGIRVSGSTELPRDVSVQAVPGSECAERQFSVYAGLRIDEFFEIDAGPFAVRPAQTIRDYGRFALCAYVEDDDGGPAEAMASQSVLITPPCTRAWARADRAHSRVADVRRRMSETWRVTRRLRLVLRAARRAAMRADAARARGCAAP